MIKLMQNHLFLRADFRNSIKNDFIKYLCDDAYENYTK